MNNPKLYRPILIRFSSLRNKVGAGLGVIFDCDEMVERVAMRVRVESGWKWQIKNLRNIQEYDYYVEEDQFILDEIGSDDEVSFPNNKYFN